MAYTNLSDLFKGICDAIRAKKGTTGTINHQDIPSEIESIETGADVSGVTANASDVRNDKYFVRSDGTLLQGSMTTVTKPSPSITVNPNGLISSNYSMSSGYVAEGSVAQTHYLSSSDDSDFVSSNIKSGVNIFGVLGSYSGNSSVGYIGSPLDATRDSGTSICFRNLDGDDTDNVIGFYVVATDTVDSSSSYDYIVSMFTYGTSFIVQSVVDDASVVFNGNSKGSYLSWDVTHKNSETGPIAIDISIDDDYLRFRSGVTYRCFPIYKTGGADVSVDIEVTT